MINPDIVPDTMEGAVDLLVAGLTEADKEGLRQAAAIAKLRAPIIVRDMTTGAERVIEPTVMGAYHFSSGMTLRNAWSFWEPDTPLKRDCIEKYRIAHADDMSSLLLEWTAFKVLEQPFDPVQYCERFHAHWADFGMTSIEAGTPS